MFIIISTLLALDRCSEDGADRLLTFFNPALNWIQRWLPLFYVPTLVVLPQALEGIAGEPRLNSSPGFPSISEPCAAGVRWSNIVLLRRPPGSCRPAECSAIRPACKALCCLQARLWSSPGSIKGVCCFTDGSCLCMDACAPAQVFLCLRTFAL